MKFLKIAMFGHKRFPSREGGIEVVVTELAQRMVRLGHRVICYNRAGQAMDGNIQKILPTDTYQGVQVKTVPTLDRKGLAAVTASFFSAIEAAFSDADIIHIHAEGPACMCWLPKIMGKKIIVTIHGLDWKRAKWQNGFGSVYIKMGERMAVRFADRIIVLSHNMQDYFLREYHRETILIPNGRSEHESVHVDKICQEYNLKSQEYLLFLGRLVPEKGIHYLIEAYQNMTTDMPLVIAGASSDSDDYVSQLKQMARNNKKILFTGYVQGRILEELYSNAYLYVLPSDLEGMPLTLLEAMSYGNCCVVSDIPECTEIVDSNAVVFPAGNVAALQNTLQTLCDQPHLVEQYRHAIKEHVLGKYNWDEITHKTLELYQELYS